MLLYNFDVHLCLIFYRFDASFAAGFFNAEDHLLRGDIPLLMQQLLLGFGDV